MHVAVIGAGAIGAVVAGAASESGHEVVVCVRTPIESLTLERDGEDRAVKASFESRPDALPSSQCDVVWVTTKVTDTAGAAPWLARLCGPDTVIASVQNGLDHEARLAPFVPAGKVVPALAYIAAERLGPGRVRHLAGDRLVTSTDCEERLTEAVGAGGLVVRGVTDMRTAAWQKLLGNLVANPITALTMRRIGVMREPGMAELARGLLIEALLVGRAEGAQLRDQDVEAIVEGTGRYGQRTGSSMLYDRMAGRPLEHQFLTGEVVRRGRAHGIPVPLNSAMLALLEAIDRGREAEESEA
jgi:2-dehydropantoate 2-reductase